MRQAPPSGRPPSLFSTIAIAAVIGLLLPALVVGGLLVGWREPENARAAFERDLADRLDLMAKSLSVLVWNLDLAATRELSEAAAQAPDVVRVTVYEGRSPSPWVAVERSTHRHGRPVTGDRPVMREGLTIGRVQIEFDDHVWAASAARQRWLYAATVGGQLLVSLALIVWLLNSRLARPLQRLGRFADDLAAGRFGSPLPEGRTAEVEQLGQAMDGMRGALQQQFESQRTLIERLRGLAETVPGVVFQLVRDRDGTLHFRYASEAAREHLGLAPDELLADAERLFERIAAVDRDAVRRALAASAESLSPWQQAFRVAPDEAAPDEAGGDERWLYANAVVRALGDGADDGATVGAIGWHGFLTDISRQRRDALELQRYRDHLEDLVRERTAELAHASAAAEAASRAKTAFLANMSHEIRTPLNAIIGLTRLMQREADDPGQRDRLAKVDDAARHLLGLTNQVLDLSKIEAGKLQLQLTEFGLEGLLSGLSSMVGPHADEKGVDFVVELPESLRALRLLGDSPRIAEVLLNFAGNAVKFTAAGSVRVRVAELSRDAERLRLRFEVEDTGIGIAADTLERLFREFEQGDTSTTRSHGGTGLGLAICRRLAALMDGEVGARSTPGRGSLFWFELPLRWRPAADEAPAAAPAVAGFHGQRVLLAEDNAVNREIAVAMLQALGLTVETAVDGRDLLDRFDAVDPALVLMDVQMPVLDGLDTARALRERGWRGPIVAMTASAFAEERERCLQAGMDDHVAKPAELETLAATLARWLPADAPAPTPEMPPAQETSP